MVQNSSHKSKKHVKRLRKTVSWFVLVFWRFSWSAIMAVFACFTDCTRVTTVVLVISDVCLISSAHVCLQLWLKKKRKKISPLAALISVQLPRLRHHWYSGAHTCQHDCEREMQFRMQQRSFVRNVRKPTQKLMNAFNYGLCRRPYRPTARLLYACSKSAYDLSNLHHILLKPHVHVPLHVVVSWPYCRPSAFSH